MALKRKDHVQPVPFPCSPWQLVSGNRIVMALMTARRNSRATCRTFHYAQRRWRRADRQRRARRFPGQGCAYTPRYLQRGVQPRVGARNIEAVYAAGGSICRAAPGMSAYRITVRSAASATAPSPIQGQGLGVHRRCGQGGGTMPTRRRNDPKTSAATNSSAPRATRSTPV